ncbi:MAG TPA: GGDEF domain-containing protein, partial [Jatrophihabitans sp.]|nr:GGDEF domain-containing protein [Jatrophihabitans sp.]
YAGAQLRRFAAALVCAAAIAGEGVVAYSLTAGTEATTSLVFVAAVLTTTVALLVQSGERNDALIARLEAQAAVDPLTGLTTRRVLDSAVASALDGAGDPAGTALLLMDVDHFKTINDQHGHPAGDAVLQQLAAILLRLSRRGDLVSRLGGDEIAMLLTGCPPETAVQRAEQVLDAVRDTVFDVSASSMAAAESRLLTVTLSVGVGHLPTGTGDLRSLYAAADEALYEAKRNGRNQVAVRLERRAVLSRSSG